MQGLPVATAGSTVIRSNSMYSPIIPQRPYFTRRRIVQYKMILKQDLIPIQDDPENVKGQGVPRSDANTYAERRIADLGADPGVSQGQRDHRVPRPEPGRIVRLGGTSLGGLR